MEALLPALREAGSSKARLDTLDAWKARRARQRQRQHGGGGGAGPACAAAGAQCLTPATLLLRMRAAQAAAEEKLSRDQAAEVVELAEPFLRDNNCKVRAPRKFCRRSLGARPEA
jgi:hypothetical protein